MRLYSFVPSATEILYSLGLGDQLCGVTHECDYPPDARNKPVVIRPLIDSAGMSQREIDDKVVVSMTHGHGLYSIDKALMKKNRPDVVITQELCDVCSVSLRDVLSTVEELSSSCNVVSLKPRGLEGVLEDVLTVGKACGAESASKALVRSLRARIDSVSKTASALEHPRVFVVEWYDPVFASGHWVPEMVELAGGHDGLGSPGHDSRKIPWDEVVDYDPEVLVLAPCGFDAERAVADLRLLAKNKGWASISAVRHGRVFAANGSAYFSRPGPRLVEGIELLATVIHPEAFRRALPPDAHRRIPISSLKARQ